MSKLKIYLNFTDNKKTSDDVKKEGEILTEMLEIVAKRDSLIALLEEERQRWCKSTCQTLTSFPKYTVACSSHVPNFFTHNLNNSSFVFTLTVILIAYVFFTNLIELFVNFYREHLTLFKS